MTVKVNNIMNMLSAMCMSGEYRVIKPSRSPAATVKGIVLNTIFRLFLKPIFKEASLEYVLGKRIEAPSINPAPASITMPNISIAPCIQIPRTLAQNTPRS